MIVVVEQLHTYFKLTNSYFLHIVKYIVQNARQIE